ncbi:unnamed protein product [Triticum turgidum subsp. durum]|uniref:Uncharacterized protein n=1 Tax=Triticum turgidum subsp. durum TaxID=4567 RepID=A0A9R1NWU4_TRITD|nr:unnamed protein product [Triticum turgidum subsp. durum]
MAAAASRHLCSATALLSPSAAAAPIRQRVGYGSSSNRRWLCRRWAHGPDAASRIRRLTTRSRTARVSCAYSTGGKGRLAGISVSLGRQPCLRFSAMGSCLGILGYSGRAPNTQTHPLVPSCPSPFSNTNFRNTTP